MSSKMKNPPWRVRLKYLGQRRGRRVRKQDERPTLGQTEAPVGRMHYRATEPKWETQRSQNTLRRKGIWIGRSSKVAKDDSGPRALGQDLPASHRWGRSRPKVGVHVKPRGKSLWPRQKPGRMARLQSWAVDGQKEHLPGRTAGRLAESKLKQNWRSSQDKTWNWGFLDVVKPKSSKS